MRAKKIKEKFDLMMVYLFNSNEDIELDSDILDKCYIKDMNELDKLFQKALDDKLIKGEIIRANRINLPPSFNSLTFEGLEYVENLEEPNRDSKNIFVAFNFTDEIIEIFEKYVREAIEESGFNYVVVNQETTPHDQKITDEIVAKIKSSRMIVADFTNSSTNVYFEAGFAMGMRIPVIWCCKKGHKFSFDTGQFPHITWGEGKDLKEQIKNRIKVII